MLVLLIITKKLQLNHMHQINQNLPNQELKLYQLQAQIYELSKKMSQLQQMEMQQSQHLQVC